MMYYFFLLSIFSLSFSQEFGNYTESPELMLNFSSQIQYNATVEQILPTEDSDATNNDIAPTSASANFPESSTYQMNTTTRESKSTLMSSLFNSITPTKITAAPKLEATTSKNVNSWLTMMVTENSQPCNATLDMESGLSLFWLQTGLQSVPIETDTGSCIWRYRIAFALLELLHRTVPVGIGNLVFRVQLVYIRRVAHTGRVRLVYYVLYNGSHASASSTAAALNTLDGAIAAEALGYRFTDPLATVYETNATTELPWQLLASAAACALLATAALATAAVLTLYFSCMRPRHGRRRRLTSAATGAAFEEDEDVYLDAGSLRPVAHMRANPKISYSSAGIDAIADQVTRRLEAHMSELMLGWQPTAGPRDSSPRRSTAAADPCCQLPCAERPAGDAEAAEVQLRCPQATPLQLLPMESVDGQLANGKDRQRKSPVDNGGSRRHSAIERLRNKDRLRSMQISAEPDQDSGDTVHPLTPRLRPRKPRQLPGLRASGAKESTAAGEATADERQCLNPWPKASMGRSESMIDERTTAVEFHAEAAGHGFKLNRAADAGEKFSGFTADQIACVRPFLEKNPSEIVHL